MPKTPQAAAAAAEAAGVHTSAQPVHTKPAAPAHHQPTPPRPRDEHTGMGGSYVRDPATGERRPAKP